MVTKKSLRIALLSAALVSVGFTGITRAADDTTPAKPATPPPPPPQQGGRGQFNPADFLKNYRDQFEGLKLTDDQMKKIDGFIDTCQSEVTKAADDRQAVRTAMQQLNTDVQSILTDEQKAALAKKRLLMPFDRLKATFTAENLMLTDDEKTKINGIVDDTEKEAASLADETDMRTRFQKSRQLETDCRAKLMAVLTPDQQKLIPPPPQRGGGRGGRGGRGGNGGAGAGAPPANQ